MAASVSDRLELAELAYVYASALDERDVEGFAALFTQEGHRGVYEPDSDVALLGYDGRARIADAMALLDPYGETMHVVSNHRVQVDGDEAAGVVYCLAHHNTVRDGVMRNLVMTIRYYDRYRRGGEGWRFSHRKIVRFWNELRPLLDERAAF
jgi:3-phenylpropionate/cinnamic acid dioxygenase small subunit